MSEQKYNFAYDCTLTTLDFIHFASLEIERKVIIKPVIHNYALSYAIFLKDDLPITIIGKKEIVKPNYKNDLEKLNKRGVYVTPAYELSAKIISYVWGAKEEKLFYKEEQVTKNYPPSMAVYESIAPDSKFKFYILSTDKISLPRIIRLGKKKGPASLNVKEYTLSEIHPKHSYSIKLLNPWDLSKEIKILELSSIIIIPPNRLFSDVLLSSDKAYYAKDLELVFPKLKYYAREKNS